MDSSSSPGSWPAEEGFDRPAGPHRLERSTSGPGRVIETDPLRDARWQAFVDAHPDALIYHHPAWFQVIEMTYGYRPVALACEDPSGKLIGVLPMFEKRGLLAGRHLSSLPHTPVAGPVATDAETLSTLIAAAAERVDGQAGTWLQLKLGAPSLDGLVDGLIGTQWDSTYVLELPEQPGDLRFGSSRNHSRIRWAVNKADRLGVRVRSADSAADLARWYRLYLDTMRWHMTPPRPYRFFEAMWDVIGQQGKLRLLLAERQQAQADLLAGSLFLMHGSTVHYAFNGRSKADLALRPNDAVHWRAINDACREGFRRYDFGEVSNENEGLAQFKEKWGARALHLYRYHYPQERELDRGALKPESAIRRVAERAWRRLPLKLTAVLGNWMYRYL